jgi:hypothetical protein
MGAERVGGRGEGKQRPVPNQPYTPYTPLVIVFFLRDYFRIAKEVCLQASDEVHMPSRICI